MKGSMFVAKSPLEIGDFVVLRSRDNAVHNVKDIIAIHSVRDGTTRFEYVLDGFADDVEVTIRAEHISHRIADGRFVSLSPEQSERREVDLG